MCWFRYCVVMLALVVGTSGASAQAGGGLLQLASKKAAIIELLHSKASRALVTVAQDPAFANYFEKHDHAHRHAIKLRIEKITLEVQSKFHVAEMCLIGLDGVEITRIVGREIADDLSTEEASAIFFAPGFETPHRQVHISPIYLSADVKRLVIAYVTPILTPEGKKAILHYEHDLAPYRQILMQADDIGDAVVLVVAQDGRIVLDSRKELSYDSPDGEAEPALQRVSRNEKDFADAVATIIGGTDAGAGTMTFEGREKPVAVKKVKNWTVVAIGGRHS